MANADDAIQTHDHDAPTSPPPIDIHWEKLADEAAGIVDGLFTQVRANQQSAVNVNGVLTTRLPVDGHPIGGVHGYKRVKIDTFTPPISVPDLAMVIDNPGARRIWDDLFTGARLLHNYVSPRTGLKQRSVHSTTRAIWPTTGRDLLAMVCSRAATGSEFSTFVFSITEEEAHAPPNADLSKLSAGFVRAHMDIAAWDLRLHPADGDLEISYLVQIDVRGSIPESLLRMIANSFPKCINTALDYLGKYGFPPGIVGGSESLVPRYFDYNHPENRLELTFINQSPKGFWLELRFDRVRWLKPGEHHLAVRLTLSDVEVECECTVTADSKTSSVLRVESLEYHEKQQFVLIMERMDAQQSSPSSTSSSSVWMNEDLVAMAEGSPVTMMKRSSTSYGPQDIESMAAASEAFQKFLDLISSCQWASTSSSSSTPSTTTNGIEWTLLDGRRYYRDRPRTFPRCSMEEILNLLVLQMKCRSVWDRRYFAGGELSQRVDNLYDMRTCWRNGWSTVDCHDLLATRQTRTKHHRHVYVTIIPAPNNSTVSAVVEKYQPSFTGWLLSSEIGSPDCQVRFYGAKTSAAYFWGMTSESTLTIVYSSLSRYLLVYNTPPALYFPDQHHHSRRDRLALADGEVETKQYVNQILSTDYDPAKQSYQVAFRPLVATHHLLENMFSESNGRQGCVHASDLCVHLFDVCTKWKYATIDVSTEPELTGVIRCAYYRDPTRRRHVLSVFLCPNMAAQPDGADFLPIDDAHALIRPFSCQPPQQVIVAITASQVHTTLIRTNRYLQPVFQASRLRSLKSIRKRHELTKETQVYDQTMMRAGLLMGAAVIALMSFLLGFVVRSLLR